MHSSKSYRGTHVCSSMTLRRFTHHFLRTRYGRTRATKFISIPTELDCNSYNVHIVNAALGSGLYPKLLHVNPSTGQLTTISNNQSVAFHPSSVNFKRKPSDFGVNHLTYFTLMFVDHLVSLYQLLNDDPGIRRSYTLGRPVQWRISPSCCFAVTASSKCVTSLRLVYPEPDARSSWLPIGPTSTAR